MIERLVPEEESPQELEHSEFVIIGDYLDVIIHTAVRLVDRVGQLKCKNVMARSWLLQVESRNVYVTFHLAIVYSRAAQSARHTTVCLHLDGIFMDLIRTLSERCAIRTMASANSALIRARHRDIVSAEQRRRFSRTRMRKPFPAGGDRTP